MGSTVEDFKEDPFKGKDPFSSSGEASNLDPFQNEDPFKESMCSFNFSSIGFTLCFIFV